MNNIGVCVAVVYVSSLLLTSAKWEWQLEKLCLVTIYVYLTHSRTNISDCIALSRCTEGEGRKDFKSQTGRERDSLLPAILKDLSLCTVYVMVVVAAAAVVNLSDSFLFLVSSTRLL